MWLKFNIRYFPILLLTLWVNGNSLLCAQTSRDFHDLAFTELNKGDYQLAIELYSKAISIDSMQFLSYLDRATAYQRIGRYDEAFGDLAIVISRSKEWSSKAFYNRGNLHKHLAKDKEAYDDYSASIILDPSFPQAFINRALVLENLGYFDKAILDYDSALKLDGKLYKAVFNRGGLRYKLRSYKDAEADFKKVANSESQYSTQAHFNLGMLYAKTSRYAEAAPEFEAFLKVEPQNHDAWFNLGICMFNLGNRDLACQHVSKAKSLGSIPASNFLLNECN